MVAARAVAVAIQLFSQSFPFARIDHSVPQFLTQDVVLSKNRLKVSQGFGVLIGRAKSEVGDRTGAYTWHGGIELGDDILHRNHIDVSGKKVIDLGTGTGIVGMAALLGGAKIVALTDGADECLEIAAQNIKQNFQVNLSGDEHVLATSSVGPSQTVKIGKLRWGNTDDINLWKKEAAGSFDVVLASEVAYDRQRIEPLLQTIQKLLKTGADHGVCLLRLTPELTDDGSGISKVVSRLKQLGAVIEEVGEPDSSSDYVGEQGETAYIFFSFPSGDDPPKVLSIS